MQNKKLFLIIAAVLVAGGVTFASLYYSGVLFRGYTGFSFQKPPTISEVPSASQVAAPSTAPEGQQVPEAAPPSTPVFPEEAKMPESIPKTSSTLSASCSSFNATPKVGDSVVFTGKVSGGTAPYTYSWLGAGVEGQVTPNATAKYVSDDVGPQTITFSVSDSTTVSIWDPIANKQYNSPNPQNATAKCNVTVSEVQAKEPAPVISALSVQPNSFINSNGETVNVYYNLNTEADVSVKITDKSAAEVRTYEKVSLKAGHQSFIWDGKDNSNQLVPTDTYLIRLNAVNVKGEGKNDIKVNVTNAPLQTVDLVECALNSPTLVLADNGTVTMTCDFKMDVDSAKIFVLEGDFDDATKYTSGDVIREIDSLINQKAGNVPFEWDGKELTGKIILVDVEPGTYTMVAEANKSGYETDYVFKKVSVVEELTPPPTDLCANITGVQSTIPSGYVSDGAGNCALSGGTDLCTNMTGVQLTVPAGYVSDGAGNCVVQSGGGGGGGGGTGTETGTGAGTGTGVTKTTTVSSTTNCAGFKDVAASDSACDAIEYVQSIGAMTGNPDGTFAPSDLLQRDQIAKIVLEAFDLYNQKVDYCQGLNPFPD
ncbi:S-layer homology domain-containing protein, partial [Patescibacteria group bacterium]|nr:S-layer homology domain-containing protein [Patescibacteria group bacterium]